MNQNHKMANEIISFIADKLGVDVPTILNSKQSKRMGPIRAICIYEIKINTFLKNIEIAKLFNCESHCMVSNRLLTYKLLLKKRVFRNMAEQSKFNN